jgi:hypothetical protein
MDTFGHEAALVLELRRIRQITAYARLLMVVYPTHASFAARDFRARLKIVRQQLSLHCQKPERFSIRLIESYGAPIKANESVQCLRNGVQQRFLSQVGDDCVIDLKQGPILLFTSSQRLFGPLALSDFDEGDHRAYGAPLLNDGMGPVLYGKTRTILPPIHLVIAVNALVVLESQIDGAFFNGIGSAIFAGMMLDRMKIFPEQFCRIAIAEDPGRRTICEKACAGGIARTNTLSGRIEHEPNASFALAQSLVRLQPYRIESRRVHS